MIKKRLNLDKPTHWSPFQLNGAIYDLSHLDAHTVEYIRQTSPELPEEKYLFYVTYSFHCFAKDYPALSNQDKKLLEYVTEREVRPFCFMRFSLSKQLPHIMSQLDQNLVFHGGHGSYATFKLNDDDGKEVNYFVSFAAYRYQKKLRLHVKSAYPQDEPLGRVKKVNIFAIGRALLRNKELPKP